MSSRSRDRKFWSEQEDQLLQDTVETFGRRWVEVAQFMSNNKNASQCSQRWKKITSDRTQTRWTPEEDKVVLSYNLHDRRLLQLLPHRTKKQIRERYTNVLDPTINKQKFTEQEDNIIWKYTQQYGRKWTQLSELLKGRPENMIKNRFYSYILGEYGNELKPYLIAYKNGKSTQKKKKNLKVKLKKEIVVQQQELRLQVTPIKQEENTTPPQTSCEEEIQNEESEQYSSPGLS